MRDEGGESGGSDDRMWEAEQRDGFKKKLKNYLTLDLRNFWDEFGTLDKIEENEMLQKNKKMKRRTDIHSQNIVMIKRKKMRRRRRRRWREGGGRRKGGGRQVK